MSKEIAELQTHQETAKSKPLEETKTVIDILQDNPLSKFGNDYDH